MSKASSLERLMLDLVNEEREARGLDPLRLDLRLNDSAEGHSEWMLRADRFSHTGEGGSSATDRMKEAGFVFSGSWGSGENVAWQSERGASGLADDVEDLHGRLMNSSGHRANILNPKFEVMGIGVERGGFDGWDAVMVTQNFAFTAAPLRIDGGGSSGGSGGGSQPAPKPKPAPKPQPDPAPEGSTPVVDARDIELAPGKYQAIKRFVSVSDEDGDRVLRYEIEGPDDARVKVDRKAVDVGDGHVMRAADLGKTIVQFNRSGEDQTFRIRAQDEDGWGAWDSFTMSAQGGSKPAPSPKPKPAPGPQDGIDVAVDDIVLKVGERTKLSDHLEVMGGAARAFKIVDADGGPGLWLSNRGEVDASGGLWLGAWPMSRLVVEADDRASEREMKVLVSDGESRSAWETFTVTTEWDGV